MASCTVEDTDWRNPRQPTVGGKHWKESPSVGIERATTDSKRRFCQSVRRDLVNVDIGDTVRVARPNLPLPEYALREAVIRQPIGERCAVQPS